MVSWVLPLMIFLPSSLKRRPIEVEGRNKKTDRFSQRHSKTGVVSSIVFGLQVTSKRAQAS